MQRRSNRCNVCPDLHSYTADKTYLPLRYVNNTNMKNLYNLILAALLLFVASCVQKEHTHLVQSPLTKKVSASKNGSLSGKKYLYDFNTSYYEISIRNDSVLDWRCVAGAGKGRHGTGRYYRHDVSKGVVMVGWTGDDKLSVSQVINFNTDSVKTFVTRQGKTIASQEGRVQDISVPASSADSHLASDDQNSHKAIR